MYFQYRQQQYLFKLNKGFFALCLLFFVLFCILGVWQLHRYHYKKFLLATYQHHLSESPKPLLSLDNNSLQFQSVFVQGNYVNDLTMLIQNKFYHNESGFEVVTPLRIKGQKKLLLVNRGWIKGQTHQPIPTVNGLVEVSGYIKFLDEYQFILGKNILAHTHPLEIQKIDVHELSRVTHQQFYPFILRLDASQSHGFVRDWIISTVIPARHLMYAVQWFVMALVLLIAYLGFSIERVKFKCV